MTNFQSRPYDEATITVLLEGPHTFTCDVQDWDQGELPQLGDNAAFEMARNLIMSQVLMYGELDGIGCRTIIDPARVVAIGITPTGTDR